MEEWNLNNDIVSYRLPLNNVLTIGILFVLGHISPYKVNFLDISFLPREFQESFFIAVLRRLPTTLSWTFQNWGDTAVSLMNWSYF